MSARRLVREAQREICMARGRLAWAWMFALGTIIPTDRRYYFPPALPKIHDVPRMIRVIMGPRDLLVVTRARGAPHRNLIPGVCAPTHWGRDWGVCLPDADAEFICLTDTVRARWMIILTHCYRGGAKYITIWAALDTSDAWAAAYATLRRRRSMRRCFKCLRRQEETLFSLLPKEIAREITEFME